MSKIEAILDLLQLDVGSRERVAVEQELYETLKSELPQLEIGSEERIEVEREIHEILKRWFLVPSGGVVDPSYESSLIARAKSALAKKKAPSAPVRLAAKGIDRKQEREKPIPAAIIVNDRLVAVGQLDLERSGRVFLTVAEDVIPNGLLVDGSKAQIDGVDYFIKAGASGVVIEALATFRVPRIFEVKGLKWRKAKAAFRAASNRGEDHVSIAIGK